MPRTIGSRASYALITITIALAAACRGSGDSPGDGETAASGASAASSAAPAGATEPFAFTEADLDAYERGLTKEIELVRAAQQRASSGTAQERAEARNAGSEERTMPEAARAVGMAPERYGQVRGTVHRILQTLDFQGKIDGPMQMDTARATPEMKARLAGDPMADLPAASAAALRARLDRLAPIFAQYVRLTAVGG